MTFYVLVPVIVIGLAILLIFLRLRNKQSVELSLVSNTPPIILEVQVPKTLEADDGIASSQLASMAAENMYAALHGLLREDSGIQEHFSFEMVSDGSSGIKFYVAVPQDILKFVESQIYAQYPACQIKVVEDYAAQPLEEGHYSVSSMNLSKDDFLPIKTFRDFEIDPLSAITSALSSVVFEEKIWFQILMKPIPDGWQKTGYDYVNSVRTGVTKASSSYPLEAILKPIVSELLEILVGVLIGAFSPRPEAKAGSKDTGKPALPPRLSPIQEAELSHIENKLGKMGYEVELRVLSYAIAPDRMESNLRSLTASLKQFSSSTLNSFVSIREANAEKALEYYRNRTFTPEKSFVLTVEELASVYHLPKGRVDTPNISWVYSKKSEPPSGLPVDDCCYIGETIFRNKKIRFGLANNDDRLRHMYLIGKSGTGKSTLFESMIAQDIANGFGVGVLDPHGETIDKVMEYIPENRLNDVIYFDPSDTEKPIGLNLLEMNDTGQKNLMASGLVAAIHHHFDYSWGPRLEYLLNYALLTLLEVPGTTMLGITRLLTDDNYRKFILHFVKDPVTVRFWETEFKNMKGNPRMITEAVAPIENKVNRFLASSTIRNILGQGKSTIDLWDAMNNGKIVLMNLSKGKIGEDNANLLGALLVSRIQFMALQRAKIPPQERRPFYLYVDEFQNFATGSFESILSESRKYGLGLYLTHQYTHQLPEDLLKAVFGNVGTIATYALGSMDARVLANEFAPYFNEEDIISLERFQVYIKLMMNGMTSLPFSAKILLPWMPGEAVVPKTGNRQRAIELSRQRFGTDREIVESKINKWVETPFDKGMAIALENRERSSQRAPLEEPAPKMPEVTN
jgi:hypothetical protein